MRQGEFSFPRALLGIGTGGIFGLCKSSTVRLVATIADRGARRTRAYVLEESFRSAMESTAVTAKCERVDETTHPEVFAEVIRRLLELLAKDRAIDHAPPAAGAALPPLVRIRPAASRRRRNRQHRDDNCWTTRTSTWRRTIA